jgi:CBS domain containing-hemolysin-like protein
MSYVPSIWIWLGIIACIALSALFSGLNLAIFSLSQMRLQIEADGGSKDAARVLDLRKNSNQVLATVIWGNVGANVFLTLLSDSILAGLGAFFLLSRGDHVVRRDRPAGVFLAQRLAHGGAISALPDFLARRLVFPDQADGVAARLVARR